MLSSYYTDLLASRPFLAVTGPSGSGKSTLVDGLVKFPRFRRPISFTTRARRAGEGNDEYRFITISEFQSMLGSRLRYSDEAFGNLYGMDFHSIDALFESGMLPTKEVHVNNIWKLKSICKLRPFVVTLRGSFIERDGRSDSAIAASASLGVPNLHINPRLSDLASLPHLVSNWISILSVYSAMVGGGSDEMLSTELQKNLTGYDLVAPFFNDQERATTRFFHELSESFWLEQIARFTGSVLEIGPGHGWLRRMGSWSTTSYVGVEISPHMARLSHEPTNIWVGALEDYHSPDESFDSIFGSLVDPCLTPNNLVQIARLLRAGGTFVGTAPAGEWARPLREGRKVSVHETTFKTPKGDASVTSCCFTRSELSSLLEAAGFRDVSVRSLSAGDLPIDQLPPDVSAVISKLGSDVPILSAWESRK